MLFSILIPTYKRPTSLKDCLRSIAPRFQHFNEEDYEVIVTDDNFGKETKTEITDNSLIITRIQGPGNGPAANRNNGAKTAKGEWLLFLDDDVTASSNLLNEYKNAINQFPDVSAFEGAIHPDNWQLLEKDMAECPVNISGGCFWTANVCIKNSLFAEIGMFDERFKIAAQEDQDLYTRLKKVTKILFVPEAIVTHPVRIASLVDCIRKVKASSKNFSIYLRKHSNDSIFSILMSEYKLHTIVFIKNLSKLHFKRALVEITWLIFGIPLNVYYFKK